MTELTTQPPEIVPTPRQQVAGELAAAALVVGTLIVGQQVLSDRPTEHQRTEQLPNHIGGTAIPKDITVNTPLTIRQANRIFHCRLQQDYHPATPAHNERWAKPDQKQCAQYIASVLGHNSYGWVKSDQRALRQLWTHESQWSANADNPTSSAYGIPQALTSKTSQYGHGKELSRQFGDGKFSYFKNPFSQLRWGLAYIRDNYGNPRAAWRFWQNHHWY
jgi:hypothetical protein